MTYGVARVHGAASGVGKTFLARFTTDERDTLRSFIGVSSLTWEIIACKDRRDAERAASICRAADIHSSYGVVEAPSDN